MTKSAEMWPGMGERIYQRLQELGYKSVEDFTQKRGYGLGLFYKWIRGEVAPRRSNVIRLASDLDVSLQWLMFGTATHVEGVPVDEPPHRRGGGGSNGSSGRDDAALGAAEEGGAMGVLRGSVIGLVLLVAVSAQAQSADYLEQKVRLMEWERAISDCKTLARAEGQDYQFDAYVSGPGRVKFFGTNRARYAFEKCMDGRGQSFRADR